MTPRELRRILDGEAKACIKSLGRQAIETHWQAKLLYDLERETIKRCIATIQDRIDERHVEARNSISSN